MNAVHMYTQYIRFYCIVIVALSVRFPLGQTHIYHCTPTTTNDDEQRQVVEGDRGREEQLRKRKMSSARTHTTAFVHISHFTVAVYCLLLNAYNRRAHIVDIVHASSDQIMYPKLK